ncbi:TetR/AcrR family transcriptional regulator [Ruegeria sp. HKCCA4707]|uniref:TetR/AcrR family transcriptional regulator n=1 Tax=Ruegeria sp. HKCCA4707 TaxID=2682984 RepID=UPI0014889A07|nr:TetR/AcrR family transcriptional regulator [Ruegeria sp. HKCCA4707]
MELTDFSCNQVITLRLTSKSTGDYLSARLRPSGKLEVKTRNPAVTQEALLKAARLEFHRAGYDGASTRKIASDAGCNAALINRYFGSKIGLFEAVMESCSDLSPLRGLTTDQLVVALVDIALSKADHQIDFDPMVVAIKSSGSAEAHDIVRKNLGNPMVEELSSIIGGEKAPQRAGLLLSIISGVFVGRVSAGADALSKHENDTLRTLLGMSMTAVLSAGEAN